MNELKSQIEAVATGIDKVQNAAGALVESSGTVADELNGSIESLSGLLREFDSFSIRDLKDELRGAIAQLKAAQKAAKGLVKKAEALDAAAAETDEAAQAIDWAAVED